MSGKGQDLAHHAECWKEHIDCAVKKVEELRAELERARAALKRAEDRRNKFLERARKAEDTIAAARNWVEVVLEDGALAGFEAALRNTKREREVYRDAREAEQENSNLLCELEHREAVIARLTEENKKAEAAARQKGGEDE